MIIYFFTIFIILIILYLIIYLLRKNINTTNTTNTKNTTNTTNTKNKILEEVEFRTYFENIMNVDQNALNTCQVPTLNTQQCYNSREYECPITNGSYLQCTNNYIPKPNTFNSDCGNRTFDMVDYPQKISENCYYNQIGFDREMMYNKAKFI